MRAYGTTLKPFEAPKFFGTTVSETHEIFLGLLKKEENEISDDVRKI
jgi:hypothetical protein